MKQLFDDISAKCSKQVTNAYSTSFSLGIYFLNAKIHEPIYGIYGFVRLADEIVDSFHGYNKAYLLQKFRHDTIDAIEQEISLNPILNNFQKVVHTYSIEWELIDTFLKSMEMDLEKKNYDAINYNQYILGSAEVVGLMCLRVFTGEDVALYNGLTPYAMKLGAAFQKVNFLRDLKEDYNTLGRIYFPGVDFFNFSSFEKKKIEREIQADFDAALIGIKALPLTSRRGVYLAYFYYKKLFFMIKETPPEHILNRRIRIANLNKLGLMLLSLLRCKLNIL